MLIAPPTCRLNLSNLFSIIVVLGKCYFMTSLFVSGKRFHTSIDASVDCHSARHCPLQRDDARASRYLARARHRHVLILFFGLKKCILMQFR